jgi:succinate dehydrogenase / fumarate reductase cytochrome b subunit
MRFIQMPETVRTEEGVRHVAYVTYDPGLMSLSERIHVQLERVSATEVKAVAKTPGKAMLLMVRDTFKSPLMCSLYTVFVLAACFHAFNGLWTVMITWGFMLSIRSQRAILPLCWFGVGLFSFLGLAAIWGSYFLNLRT